MRGFKETNKINWNEGKYKKTLNNDEKRVYKSLTRKQKDTAVIAFVEGHSIDLLQDNLKEVLSQEEAKQIGISSKESNDKLINFFNTQGIFNPSETTLEVFKQQKIYANFDNFYHAIGQFTLNMEKQAQYNYYMSQQKQNFIHIAQRDKIIKQNEEIIQLLKEIVDR